MFLKNVIKKAKYLPFINNISCFSSLPASFETLQTQLPLLFALKLDIDKAEVKSSKFFMKKFSVSESGWPSFSQINLNGGSPSITEQVITVLFPARRSFEKLIGPISGFFRAENEH